MVPTRPPLSRRRIESCTRFSSPTTSFAQSVPVQFVDDGYFWSSAVILAEQPVSALHLHGLGHCAAQAGGFGGQDPPFLPISRCLSPTAWTSRPLAFTSVLHSSLSSSSRIPILLDEGQGCNRMHWASLLGLMVIVSDFYSENCGFSLAGGAFTHDYELLLDVSRAEWAFRWCCKLEKRGEANTSGGGRRAWPRLFHLGDAGVVLRVSEHRWSRRGSAPAWQNLAHTPFPGLVTCHVLLMLCEILG